LKVLLQNWWDKLWEARNGYKQLVIIRLLDLTVVCKVSSRLEEDTVGRVTSR